MTLFDADEPFNAHEAARYRNRENRGRRAGVYASYDTTGSGVLEFEERIDFGLIYVQEPWVSYGSRVNMDDIRTALDLEDDDPPPILPGCTGFVTEYDMDENDNYVGAWVAVTVYYPDGIPPASEIEIRHYFTFEAVAIKEVPL